MKLNKRNYIIYGIILLSFLLIVFMNRGTYPIFKEDSLAESYHFMKAIKENGMNGALGFWDWNCIFGANRIAVNSNFYYTYFLAYLLILLPESLFPYCFLIMSIINYTLLAVTAKVWLKSITKDKLAVLTGIFILVFNGWNAAFYRYQFMNAIWILPLILYGTELFLKKNKVGVLVFSVALCSITNYYMFVLYIPFSCLYALVRYIILTDKIEILPMLKKAVMFLVFLFLGIGISMPILLPSLMNTFQTPRLGSEIEMEFINFKEIYRLITGLLSPVASINNHNYFIDKEVSDSILTYGGGPVVYSLMIALLMVPQYFLMFKKKEKYSALGAILLLLVFTAFKPFYHLLNGSWDSRWMYMFVYLNVYMTVMVLSHKEDINNTLLKISGVIIGALLLASFGFSYMMNWGSSYKVLLINIIIQLFVIAGYVAVLSKRQKFDTLFCVLLIAEALVVMGNLFFVGNLTNPRNAFVSKNEFEEAQLLGNKQIEYIQSIDSDFYRIDEINNAAYTSNNSYSNNYQSFTFYNSVYNFNVENFSDGRFKSYGLWHFVPNEGNSMIKTLLGAKYFIDYKNTGFVPYGYQYLNTVEGVDIYLNQYSLPVGYAMDKTLSKTVFNTLSKNEQDRLLPFYLVTEDENSTEFEFMDHRKLIEKDAFGSTLIQADHQDSGVWFIEEKDQYLLNADRGYELYSNGELVLEHMNKDYDFPLVIPANQQFDEMYVHILTQDKWGYAVNYDVYYDDYKWIDEWYDSIIDESFYDVQVSGSGLTAKLTLKESKPVFVSISYDHGWSLYVDGEKTEIMNVNDGFIGFYAEAGAHEIVLKYQPQGWIAGWGICFVSIAVVAIYLFNRKKEEIS